MQYEIIEVIDRVTRQQKWIKAARFDGNLHIKAEGARPIMKDYLVNPSKPIILDPLYYAVQKAEEQRKEAVIPVEAFPPPEEEKESLNFDTMKMQELRTLAKKKGMKMLNTTKKEEILAWLKGLGV